MNFALSEEQELVRRTFARFCSEKIQPQAAAIDESGEFPIELFKELARMGFFGLRYPDLLGGTNQDLSSYCLAVSEIARGSLSLAAAAAMQSLMGTNFLYVFGSAEIHERLLKPAIQGEKIGAICITEPDAGSDLSGISTSAKKVEGGYMLNGEKMWVTSATIADFFTVFARCGEGSKLTAFLVEKGSPGLTVGRTIKKLGCWALPTSAVSMMDCFVPESNRLGQEGEAEASLRAVLPDIRIMTAALSLGVARAALDDAQLYASQRKQFGKSINQFQAIQLKLADMATGLEAARHLVYYAAWLKDNKRPHEKEAAMAKLFASEQAVQICDQATRILGAYGYAMEYSVQRYFRDIRFTLYGGGTSEILKLVIARELSK